MWRADDPQCNEAAKIRWEIVPYTRGQGLDLGCGPEKAFPHFVGVDNRKDVELFGIDMAPDIVVETCERLPDYADASQDFVFSSHLLEHIDDQAAALRSGGAPSSRAAIWCSTCRTATSIRASGSRAPTSTTSTTSS